METILASENMKTIEEKPKHRGPLTNVWAGKIVFTLQRQLAAYEKYLN